MKQQLGGEKKKVGHEVGKDEGGKEEIWNKRRQAKKEGVWKEGGHWIRRQGKEKVIGKDGKLLGKRR